MCLVLLKPEASTFQDKTKHCSHNRTLTMKFVSKCFSGRLHKEIKLSLPLEDINKAHPENCSNDH